MNTQELIKKASSGKISQNEIEKVHEALMQQEGDEYDLLLILGRAEAKQYKNDIEKYLNASYDPMLARLALQILCRYWGEAKNYKDVIKKFIESVDWDEDGDVRLMAIGCVTEVFKSEVSSELLRCVYNVFIDEKEGKVARGAAYEVLAIVSGKDLNDLSQPLHFDFENDVDPSVIEKIKNII